MQFRDKLLQNYHDKSDIQKTRQTISDVICESNTKKK